MTVTFKTRMAAALIAAASSLSLAQAADITGAGASFVFPVMSKWSADYAGATGNRVNYQSIGSGGGIAQIKAGTVDFGSSDAPLKSEDLASSGLAQFPSVIGGVVPAFNLPGIAAGAMKLDPDVLAEVGQSMRLGDAVYTLDDAVYKDGTVYASGVIRPAEDANVVLLAKGSHTPWPSA